MTPPVIGGFWLQVLESSVARIGIPTSLRWAGRRDSSSKSLQMKFLDGFNQAGEIGREHVAYVADAERVGL